MATTHYRSIARARLAVALSDPSVDEAVENTLLGWCDAPEGGHDQVRSWFSHTRKELLDAIEYVDDPVEVANVAALFVAQTRARWMTINTMLNYKAVSGVVDMEGIMRGSLLSQLIGIVERLVPNRDVEAVFTALNTFSAAGEIAKVASVPSDRLDRLYNSLGSGLAARLQMEARMQRTLAVLGKVPLAEEDSVAVRAAIAQLQSAFDAFNRAGEELHRHALDLRTVPLRELEGRVQRVLDASCGHAGKNCNLRTHGFDIAIDHMIADTVMDTLAEIVKFTVEHSIEDAAGRAAAGKDPTGSVEIVATYQGEKIVLTLKDDGSGTVGSGDAEGAEEQQIDPRITDSLARGADDLAGLKGSLQLIRRPGRGLHWTLSVAVPLPILQTLVIRANGRRYGWPAYAIEEILPSSQANLSAAGGQTVADVHGHTLPVVRLADVLQLPASSATLDHDSVLLVTKVNDARVCVEVDIVERQIDAVLLPVGDVIGQVPLLCGANIIDEGPPLLTVNPVGVINEIKRMA